MAHSTPAMLCQAGGDEKAVHLGIGIFSPKIQSSIAVQMRSDTQNSPEFVAQRSRTRSDGVVHRAAWVWAGLLAMNSARRISWEGMIWIRKHSNTSEQIQPYLNLASRVYLGSPNVVNRFQGRYLVSFVVHALRPSMERSQTDRKSLHSGQRLGHGWVGEGALYACSTRESHHSMVCTSQPECLHAAGVWHIPPRASLRPYIRVQFFDALLIRVSDIDMRRQQLTTTYTRTLYTDVVLSFGIVVVCIARPRRIHIQSTLQIIEWRIWNSIRTRLQQQYICFGI